MTEMWLCPACGEGFYRQCGNDRYWCAMCEHGYEIKDLGSMPMGLDDDLFGGDERMTELFTTVHNSSNEELKPCPFCGGNVKIERNSVGIVEIEHIDDGECILNVLDSFWVGELEIFIDGWNRRARE